MELSGFLYVVMVVVAFALFMAGLGHQSWRYNQTQRLRVAANRPAQPLATVQPSHAH